MSDTILLQLLGGAIGGAFVSSVVGPYIAQSNDRRKRRSDVLASIAKVEESRWAGKDQVTHAEFRSDLRTLRVAALIAQTDRYFLEKYLVAAAVARQCSDDEYTEGEPEEFTAGIPGELANYIGDLLVTFTNSLWSPFKSKMERRKLIGQLRLQEVKVKKVVKKAHPYAYWDIRY